MPELVKCLKCQREIPVRESINMWKEKRWVAVCECGTIYSRREGTLWIPIVEVREKVNKR